MITLCGAGTVVIESLQPKVLRTAGLKLVTTGDQVLACCLRSTRKRLAVSSLDQPMPEAVSVKEP